MEEKFMATIDLIVLGILKKESMSAYDIQKMVEYRNISKWVKISTPSIYKKAIQLEEKGLIRGEVVKEGKMPEKAVYSLTEAGESEFQRLMFEISSFPELIPLHAITVMSLLFGQLMSIARRDKIVDLFTLICSKKSLF